MSNVDLVRSDGFSKIIASVLCCRGRGRAPAFQAFLSSLALGSRPVNASRVSSSRESRSRPLRLSTEGTFQVDGISTTPQSPPQVAGWTTEPYHGVPAAPCSVGAPARAGFRALRPPVHSPIAFRYQLGKASPVKSTIRAPATR